MEVTVTKAGFLTTVQDSGRIGVRQFGVSSGGALDVHGSRLANLLVGNPGSFAALEITAGTVRIRFTDSRTIAWIGGDYVVSANEQAIPAGRVILVNEREELAFAGPTRGFRAWLAISGGIDVPRVLSSRSTDLRAKFGGWQGRALRDDDVLPLGENPAEARKLISSLRTMKISSWSAPFEWANPAARPALVRVIRGKDWDRFKPSAKRAFLKEPFPVSAQSDRMGVRLEGPVLERNDSGDLISEPVAPGTIQIPPGGHPILLLGDCQTIGGYPKLAQVISCDMPRAVQLAPGDEVRFSEVSLGLAHQLLDQRERDVETFRIGLTLRR